MKEDETLIPDLKKYRSLNGSDFSIDAWTEIEGNIKLAIGYTSLFWPAFVEHEHGVFLKSHFSVSTFEQLKIQVGNYAQIESLMNHIHIVDLFAVKDNPGKSDVEALNKEQVIYLGRKLMEMYSAKLRLNFPTKIVEVTSNFDDNLGAIEDYQFTFYQLENLSRNTK